MVPPAAVQPNAGCDAIAFPNWSFTVALKACVAFGSIVAEPGLPVALVAGWSTVTTPVLVGVGPSWRVTVAWRVWGPAGVNVGVLFFAAWGRWARRVPPLGPAVTAQV